jgi:hypothetical protein
LWSQLAKTATRPADEPEPRPKVKEKTGGGGLLKLAARALIKRVARRAATIPTAMRAGFHAAKAMTVRGTDIPPEAYGPAGAALDAANPYWDFSLDGDAGISAAGSGPSLDL